MTQDTISLESEDVAEEKLTTDFDHKFERRYFVAVSLAFIHALAIYGAYRLIYCHYLTLLWSVVLTYCIAVGITMGAHRLFSHRTFKTKFVVKLFLVIFQTMSGQFSVYTWSKMHRVHHKYSDTDADPHNAKRGFFHSHIGWFMKSPHPLVLEKMKAVNVKDLEADALVMNQHMYYHWWILLFFFLFPVGVPVYFWNENYLNALMVCVFFRYIMNLHVTLLVNSAAHMYGNKPFDKNILSSQNKLVSALAVGEGWHNYHHAFPYDYRTAEYGTEFQFTTHVIDLLARYGLVYDLKTASDEVIRKKAMSKGDGTYHLKTDARKEDSS